MMWLKAAADGTSPLEAYLAVSTPQISPILR